MVGLVGRVRQLFGWSVGRVRFFGQVVGTGITCLGQLIKLWACVWKTCGHGLSSGY